MRGYHGRNISKKINYENFETIDLPTEDLNWATVSLSEVVNKGKRLEASTFNIERRKYEKILESNKYPLIGLLSPEYVTHCYNGTRTKREYISPEKPNAVKFLGGSEILDIYPKTDKYLDYTNPKYESYKVEKGDVLLTCSGTIGRVSFVLDNISNSLVSQHVIKIRAKQFQGYLYAYLKTELAQSYIKSNKYGSLVSHIEPEHLKEVPIPNPPTRIKEKIHNLIVKSYKSRDESNELIDEATKLLVKELELPSINKLKEEAFSYSKEINSFSCRLSELDGRLEGSYHIPFVKLMEDTLLEKADIKYLSDKDIVKNIVLPGRFTRIYVDKDSGIPFIGGKDLFQLKSDTGKYLSKKAHKDRLKKELLIKENSIILPSRGTIGEVMLSMPHQIKKCAISDNLIQIESTSNYVGYIYIFLNSEYGKGLIYRQKYGGVVNAIEPSQLEKIGIPFSKNETFVKKINEIAIRANNLRYEAYKLEQEAIKIMNEEVLGL